MPKVQIHRGLLRTVAGTSKVRKALADRARAIAARADQLATQPPAYEMNAKVEEGIRPKGRPYARVISYDADQEFGTYGIKRRRILGRAADIK